MTDSARITINTPGEVRRGLFFMIVGALMIPGLDALAKILGESYGLPAGQIALARFGMQTLMVLPLLVAIEGVSALRVPHLGLNLLRGVLLGLASFAFFLALKFMPLANAIAIFFVEPMLITLMSALFLGETIGWRRGVSVAIGFVGALIVIRPNFAALGLVAGLPLVTAAFVAIYAILNRRLAGTSTPLAMHFYSGVGGTAAMLVVMTLWQGTVPELRFGIPTGAAVWAMIIGVGAFATVGHLLFINAFHLAPASVLAPFGYLEIVSAALLGLILFGEFPDLTAWLGIAIIVGSGVTLFLHERGAMSAAPSPTAP